MIFQSLSIRSQQKELMDADNIVFSEFDDCLQCLEKINSLTLAYRPTLGWIKEFKKKSLTILDAGSGGGDMLRCLAQRYPYHRFIGIDANPWSKQSAEKKSRLCKSIFFETADIFSISAHDDIDLIISSLFTHHLDDQQLINFLQWMDKTARLGWFINDLHRHPVPYYFIKYTTILLCRNRLIRHDAPVSVARSFSKKDWETLLQLAGIPQDQVRIKWYFPFRYCVSRVKT